MKQFITSGKNADVAVVFAVTDKAAGKKGISAFVVPTATPGYVVARLEEIAAGDGGTSTAISVTNCPVNALLMRYGNAAQKQRWLVPLAKGELLGVFCLTEPHVGSDASALKTTAAKDGDGYVIDGVKQFITSGKHGDLAIVIAVTDKAADSAIL